MSRGVVREQLSFAPDITIATPMTGQADLSSQLAGFASDTATILADKAERTYELQFKNQAIEGVTQAYERNKTNPTQLDKELKSLRAGLVKNAPFNLREQFDADFQGLSRPYMNKATEAHGYVMDEKLKLSTLQNLDLSKKNLSYSAADLMSDDPVARADAQQTIQGLIIEMSKTASQVGVDGMPILSASEQFRVMKETMDDTVQGGIRDAYDRSPDKGAFINRFKTGELKASIFLDEKGTFAEASVRDGMDRGGYERAINYMESDYASKIKQASENIQKQNNEAYIGGVLRGEAILDPTSKDSLRAADDFWENNIAPKLSGLSSSEAIAHTVEFTSKTGIIPSSLKTNLVAQVMNGSPITKAVGADMVNAIAEGNPSVLWQIPDSVRGMSKAISDNINSGMDPEAAVESAQMGIFKRDDPEYKERAVRFKDEKSTFSPGSFTSVFRDDPEEIPAAMQADWETLNRKYYMDNGVNIDSSKKLADERIKATWKITKADGKPRWMKYAPEALYGNEQIGSDWIGAQLQADIASLPNDTGEPPNVILSVDPSSIRRPDPHYLMFEQDADGVLKPFLKPNGKQAIFKPDYKSSPEYKKLLEEYQGDDEAAMAAAINRRRRALINQQLQDEGVNVPDEVGLGRAF